MIGSITYALMLAVGVAVALRLAAALRRAGSGGARSAGVRRVRRILRAVRRIAAAVPAALLLFMRAQVQRGWLFAALMLLVVPWMMATSAALFLAPLFPVAYLTYALWPQ